MTTQPKPSHTPEPWINSGNRMYMGAAMEKREIAVATKADPSIRHQAEANAARIVACVNAMAGLADPEGAIKAAREAVHRIARIVDAYRDEMPSDSDKGIDAYIKEALAALGGGK